MAVAFDAKATADKAQNLGPSPITLATLTITAAGTAVIGITQISVVSGTPPTCTAMTWNSVAMTQLGTVTSSDGFNRCTIFGLASPATGNHTLSATYTGAITSADVYLDCVSYSGTATTTSAAFPTADVKTDASTPAGSTYPTTAFSVTTANGDAVLAACQAAAALYTGMTAGTLRRNDGSLNGQCTWGDHLAVGNPTTAQFTGGGTQVCCGVAIHIAQPGAAGPVGHLVSAIQAVNRASYY